ncbi:MAG: hypothetical protein HOW71_31390, partial [Nonomuraea sp.]|nr:hypothetical protein [Nonomuraea sp.]
MNMLGCKSTGNVRKGGRRPTAPIPFIDHNMRHTRTIPVGAGAATRVRGCSITQAGRRRGWEFEPSEVSVPAARHRVGAQARRWGFAEEGETAELLVSEVVANALPHT